MGILIGLVIAVIGLFITTIVGGFITKTITGFFKSKMNPFITFFDFPLGVSETAYKNKLKNNQEVPDKKYLFTKTPYQIKEEYILGETISSAFVSFKSIPATTGTLIAEALTLNFNPDISKQDLCNYLYKKFPYINYQALLQDKHYVEILHINNKPVFGLSVKENNDSVQLRARYLQENEIVNTNEHKLFNTKFKK